MLIGNPEEEECKERMRKELLKEFLKEASRNKMLLFRLDENGKLVDSQDVVSEDNSQDVNTIIIEDNITKDIVNKIIVEQLGIDECQITPDARLVEDFAADSLDQVKLIMAFEKEFGITIPDEVAEQIVTVRDIYRMVEKYQ